LDGWILKSVKGNSYYGILDKEKTVNMLTRHHFSVKKAWIKGQSNYVLARIDDR
jgi:hypothetical protein